MLNKNDRLKRLLFLQEEYNKKGLKNRSLILEWNKEVSDLFLDYISKFGDNKEIDFISDSKSHYKFYFYEQEFIKFSEHKELSLNGIEFGTKKLSILNTTEKFVYIDSPLYYFFDKDDVIRYHHIAQLLKESLPNANNPYDNTLSFIYSVNKNFENCLIYSNGGFLNDNLEEGLYFINFLIEKLN